MLYLLEVIFVGGSNEEGETGNAKNKVTYPYCCHGDIACEGSASWAPG